jgi:hypothetical protein
MNRAVHAFQWDGRGEKLGHYRLGPCLDAKFSPKFHYAKRKFFITSKYRHMHRILNVDEIKN